MLWKGPYEDGITQSLLNKYRQCPYRFYLYSILGLQDAKELHMNLIWGDIFHKGLELLIASKDINGSIAGMLEYAEARYPQRPSSYDTSTKLLLRKFRLSNYDGVWQTEVKFEHPVKLPSGRVVKVRGKMDGYQIHNPTYGKVLGEHKCKGYIDPVRTRKELKQDLQVNIYCYLHDIEWINYDLILIPEAQKYAPARNFDETPATHIERLFTGPCGSYNGMYPINANSHNWVANLPPLFYPREEQEQYWNSTVYPYMEQLCDWWEHVTSPSFDPERFNHIYFKTPVREFQPHRTDKFECDYYRYLVGEQQLSDLVPVPSMFAELDEVE